jgi:hypothetical protein
MDEGKDQALLFLEPLDLDQLEAVELGGTA